LVWDDLSSTGDAEQHVLIDAKPLAQSAKWLNDRAALCAAPIDFVG